jgi:hypothetical protein
MVRNALALTGTNFGRGMVVENASERCPNAFQDTPHRALPSALLRSISGADFAG